MSESLLQNYPQITQLTQTKGELRAEELLQKRMNLCQRFVSALGTRLVLLVELSVTTGKWYVVSVDEHVLYLSPYLERIAVSHKKICDFADLN